MKPSIFNDVIGPVMRGPSSSHTAAAHRIGTMLRRFHNPENCMISVEFDRNGSLATTYEGQGSAMGLISGLCGLSILDPEIKEYKLLPAKHNFSIEFSITDYDASHPNTYKIILTDNNHETVQIVAISTGGGMIKVTGLDGFPVSINGDLYETLIRFKNKSAAGIEELNLKLKHHLITETELIKNGRDNYLLVIKSHKSILKDTLEISGGTEGIFWMREIEPVLPVMSGAGQSLPFADIHELQELIEREETDLAQLAVRYECALAGIDDLKVFSLMSEIAAHIQLSIKEGLKEKSYPGRILGHQSHLILKAEKEGKIIPSPVKNGIISKDFIYSIGSLVKGNLSVSNAPARFFKTVGNAIFDLYGAKLVYEKVSL